MIVKRKIRVASNPHKKRRAAPKRNATKHRRRTPAKKNGPTVKRSPNPKRRKNTMPKARKNRAAPRKNPTAKRRRKNPSRRPNPFAITRHAARKNPRPKGARRRKNPETSPGNAIQLVKDGAVVMLGLVATRQIPQMILAEKNTGMIGYASNAATAAVLAFGASKLVSPRAGYFAALGGAAYLLNRILTEKVSPIGQYLALSGVGDHAAVTSLGEIKDTYFPYPAIFDANGNPVVPQQIIDAARAALPAGNGGQQLAGVNPYLSTAYSR